MKDMAIYQQIQKASEFHPRTVIREFVTVLTENGGCGIDLKDGSMVNLWGSDEIGVDEMFIFQLKGEASQEQIGFAHERYDEIFGEGKFDARFEPSDYDELSEEESQRLTDELGRIEPDPEYL